MTSKAEPTVEDIASLGKFIGLEVSDKDADKHKAELTTEIHDFKREQQLTTAEEEEALVG